MNKEDVANKVFEAFHKNSDSDDFNLYEPGNSDHFYLEEIETGAQWRVSVIDVVKQDKL